MHYKYVQSVIMMGLLALRISHSTAAETTATQPRSENALHQELKDARAAYKAIFPKMENYELLRNPAARAELSSKVIPVIRQIENLQSELRGLRAASGAATETPNGTQALEVVQHNQVLLILGDGRAAEESRKAIANGGPAATVWKISTALAAYLTATSPEEQIRALGDYSNIYRQTDAKDQTVDISFMSLSQYPALSPAVSERLWLIPSERVPGRYTKIALQTHESESVLKNVVEKPIILAGKTVDGKAFSTADWKGKVILVDFWATWCGPCKKELPQIKAAYQKYHSQGLEVLGISNDRTKAALTEYLANDKELAWPQLFEEPGEEESQHPLTAKYRITAIPRMFLIDKNGILRTVDARENYQKLIPELLAESAAVTHSESSADLNENSK